MLRPAVWRGSGVYPFFERGNAPHVALLPVRIERDVVRMTHRALTGKVVDFVHSAPRQDAAPFQPHDEVAAFPYEKMKKWVNSKPLAIDKRR